MDFHAKVLRAAQLAVEFHNGQQRKMTKKPYVVHPLRVAQLVAEAPLPSGANREICILAAILHDTIEDTAVEPDQIAREFGKDVYDVVLELTMDLALPRAERIRKLLDRADTMSPGAKLVKLADRLDNMRDMAQRDRKFIQRYCHEAGQIVEKLRGACPPLEAEILKIIREQEGGA